MGIEYNPTGPDGPEFEPKSDIEDPETLKEASNIYAERKPLSTEKLPTYEETNEISSKLFGQNLFHSPEQFNETLNTPESKGLAILTDFQNQTVHLHNSLIGQVPTWAGLGVDLAVSKLSPFHKKLLFSHANGNYQKVAEGLDRIHGAYKALINDNVVTSNRSFGASYSGMHLNEMVNNTLPSLKKAYRDIMGV